MARQNLKQLCKEMDDVLDQLCEVEVSTPEWYSLINKRNQLSVKIAIAENPPEEEQQALSSIHIIN